MIERNSNLLTDRFQNLLNYKPSPEIRKLRRKYDVNNIEQPDKDTELNPLEITPEFMCETYEKKFENKTFIFENKNGENHELYFNESCYNVPQIDFNYQECVCEPTKFCCKREPKCNGECVIYHMMADKNIYHELIKMPDNKFFINGFADSEIVTKKYVQSKNEVYCRTFVYYSHESFVYNIHKSKDYKNIYLPFIVIRPSCRKKTEYLIYDMRNEKCHFVCVKQNETIIDVILTATGMRIITHNKEGLYTVYKVTYIATMRLFLLCLKRNKLKLATPLKKIIYELIGLGL